MPIIMYFLQQIGALQPIQTLIVGIVVIVLLSIVLKRS